MCMCPSLISLETAIYPFVESGWNLRSRSDHKLHINCQVGKGKHRIWALTFSPTNNVQYSKLKWWHWNTPEAESCVWKTTFRGFVWMYTHKLSLAILSGHSRCWDFEQSNNITRFLAARTGRCSLAERYRGCYLPSLLQLSTFSHEEHVNALEHCQYD